MTQLLEYKILRPIGGSISWNVAAAVNRAGRVVALKTLNWPSRETLPPELVELIHKLEQGPLADWASLTEERIGGLVGLVDYDMRPILWLAVEFMPGGSLRDRIGWLSWSELARLVADVAGTLSRLHIRGLSHLNVRPENVLFDTEGRPYITDMGLLELDHWMLTHLTWEVIDPAVKIRARIINYTPPGYIGRYTEAPDHRADIYQLGVMLYEATTGRLPFEGDLLSLSRKVLEEKPRPPHEIRSDIPAGLSDIVLKAMDKDPDKRYDSALEFERELRAVLRSEARGGRGT